MHCENNNYICYIIITIDMIGMLFGLPKKRKNTLRESCKPFTGIYNNIRYCGYYSSWKFTIIIQTTRCHTLPTDYFHYNNTGDENDENIPLTCYMVL